MRLGLRSMDCIDWERSRARIRADCCLNSGWGWRCHTGPANAIIARVAPRTSSQDCAVVLCELVDLLLMSRCGSNCASHCLLQPDSACWRCSRRLSHKNISPRNSGHSHSQWGRKKWKLWIILFMSSVGTSRGNLYR